MNADHQLDPERPDPDQLLAEVRRLDDLASRGRHKIFFGASPGVGKTFAMLTAARAAHAMGVDVVIGVVETHGRAETRALTVGLPTLPPRRVRHNDRDFTAFDLDGALARRPALVLVDELAHSNVGGSSRHPKRWQDVEELLRAGIDVWSTLNVQHLESLNDIVGGITGVRVRETVPDRVFDGADEVVIVDLPPDDLLQRLKAGKVYLPRQAEEAARHFFRKGNLIALRELALRRTADRVDGDMQQHRQHRVTQAVSSTRDTLMACIGPGEDGEKIVRSTARLAAQLDVPWHAVHVETPAVQRLSSAARRRVLGTLKTASDMGAHTATLSGHELAPTLVRHARRHNLAKLVVGRAANPRRWPWHTALADRLAATGPELDILQIGLPSVRRGRSEPTPGATSMEAATPASGMRPYVISAAVCAATTLLASPLAKVLELSNLVMLFLLGVVLVAVRLGRGPAVLAAFLSVGAFDFFFVPPTLSFAIQDVQYLVTFAVMLVVALVIGQMAAGLSYQARMAQRREDRMRALYEMSRDLSGALLAEQVARIGARFLAAEFDARSTLLVADAHDRLQVPAGATEQLPDLDTAIARWAFDKSQPAGFGTDTLPSSPTLYLPLLAPMRARGVLAVQPGSDRSSLVGPEQRRLLDTCASLLAISIERLHYIEVAQLTTVQMETERLRNSLLAAISHDLRTPLTALVGMAEALTSHREPRLSAPQIDIASAIRASALRMNSLVISLLDMARLESGTVRLNRQWVPLDEVIGSALASIRSALADRAITVSIVDGVPLVEIDAVLIERVLVNLLENAGKYTPPETAIHIGTEADPEHVSVWIQDKGPGLPPGREEAIFNKFERGRKESALPGVGLGLAICRAIAQAHGGTVRGETRPEGGARFTLQLPRGKPPVIDASAPPETHQEPLS